MDKWIDVHQMLGFLFLMFLGQLGLSLGVGLRADIVDLEYFGLEEMAEA